MIKNGYRAQSARDAQASGYGDESYWDYLETSAYEHHGYFRAKHEWALADDKRTDDPATAYKNHNRAAIGTRRQIVTIDFGGETFAGAVVPAHILKDTARETVT